MEKPGLYTRFRSRLGSISSSSTTTTPKEDFILYVGRPKDPLVADHDYVLILHGKKSKSCSWTYTFSEQNQIQTLNQSPNQCQNWSKDQSPFPCGNIDCGRVMDMTEVGVLKGKDRARFDAIFTEVPAMSPKEFLFAFLQRVGCGEGAVLDAEDVVRALKVLSFQ